MRSRTKWIVVLVIVAGLITAFRKPAEKYFDIARSLDIFATLFKEVNAYYVDEVDPKKLVRNGIDGMLESLDPYTDYIPEEEVESFRIATTGQYGGIGALIGVVNNKVVITDPYEGFPAHKSGLKIGDEIVSVNGVNTNGKTTSEISNLLKGQPKTDLELKIRRFGVKEDIGFKLKREKISISNLAYYGVIDKQVGYIKLDDFTPGASKEVTDALQSLKAKGVTKIILDLRDNPGGLLHEAVNVTGLFIPKGEEVVSTRGKVKDWNKSYKTLNDPVDLSIPLVVLTGSGSASAAEIVAGALQDYDRAVLVGRKTFGKGLVQTTRPLSYNAQLKVTTAKYYIPSGRCIQELDYTHRKDDGSVDKFADSLMSEFQTRQGRKVYDGHGLDPDVNVDDLYLGAVSVELITRGLIFDYAIKFCAENNPPHDFKSFELNDTQYGKFAEWIKGQKFSYTTALEKQAEELLETAKKERYFGDMENQLTALKNKIETNKASDLIRFKDEIKGLLEQEICRHYALHRGEAEYSLQRDATVLEAKRILIDPAAYQGILQPKTN